MSDEAQIVEAEKPKKEEKKRAPQKPAQRVGVVINGYGNPDGLRKCINSALAQKLPQRVNTEIVVICHDGTLKGAEACKEFAGKIKAGYLDNLFPEGCARDAGVEMLGAFDLIVFVDGQDSIAPNHIESILNARRPNTLSAYRTGQPSEDGHQPAPFDGIAWEAKAYWKLAPHKHIFAFGSEELAVRAVAEDISIIDVEVPSYQPSSEESLKQYIKKLNINFFSSGRKAVAMAKRGEPVMEKKRSIKVYDFV